MNGREGEWGLDRGRLRWLGSRAYAGSEKAISLRILLLIYENGLFTIN